MSDLAHTAPRPFCFVLMPFSKEFDDVYEIGIKEACDAAGAYAERVDEQLYEERILDRVFNQIAKADVIIADMSGMNANVFYEVGYAHALGKRTVLLTKEAKDIPFNLQHFPHIIYGGSIAALRDDLQRRVQYFVDNPAADTSESDIEVYFDKRRLASGNVSFEFPVNQVGSLKFTIHNRSSSTIEPKSLQIALITEWESPFAPHQDDPFRKIEIPDGKFSLVRSNPDAIFPDAFASLEFNFSSAAEAKGGDTSEVIFRAYTRSARRDFALTVHWVERQKSKS